MARAKPSFRGGVTTPTLFMPFTWSLVPPMTIRSFLRSGGALAATAAMLIGVAAPAQVAVAVGLPADSPALPGWVQAWIAADAQRPWPPEVPADVEAGWTG